MLPPRSKQLIPIESKSIAAQGDAETLGATAGGDTVMTGATVFVFVGENVLTLLMLRLTFSTAAAWLTAVAAVTTLTLFWIYGATSTGCWSSIDGFRRAASSIALAVAASAIRLT